MDGCSVFDGTSGDSLSTSSDGMSSGLRVYEAFASSEAFYRAIGKCSHD